MRFSLNYWLTIPYYLVHWIETMRWTHQTKGTTMANWFDELTEDEKFEFTRAFSEGRIEERWRRCDDPAYEAARRFARTDGGESPYHLYAAYLLGHFSSYEIAQISEIEDEDMAEEIELLRRQYATCVSLCPDALGPNAPEPETQRSDKYSDLSEQGQDEFIRAFNDGDYAEFYEGSDVRSVVEGMEQDGVGYHRVAGYLLGRFLTYKIREIKDAALADDIQRLRREYASCGLYDF